MALFFPVANAEASTLEGNGSTDAALRAAAKSFQDLATNMSAQIDGRAVQDLGAYRVQSPLFTFGPLPNNNVLQSFGITAPAGSTSPSVGDGVYLMTTPLSAGRHTIHFHAEVPDFNFLLDITYHLTVAGGGGAAAVTPAPASTGDTTAPSAPGAPALEQVFAGPAAATPAPVPAAAVAKALLAHVGHTQGDGGAASDGAFSSP